MPNEPAPPITRLVLLTRILELYKQLAEQLKKYDGAEYEIVDATFDMVGDLIDGMVADELRDSAEKIKKITEAINVQTKRLKKVKENIEEITEFAGQLQKFLDIVGMVIPYL